MTPDQDLTGHPQVGLHSVLARPAMPTIAATACLFVAMLLPVTTITVSLGGNPMAWVGASGTALFGLLGWLAVIVFAAAVATHVARGAMPYRRLADRCALAAWAVLVAWAAYQILHPVPGEVSSAMQDVQGLVGTGPMRLVPPDFAADLRRATQRMVTASPALGMLPLLAAGPLAWLGMRRASRGPAA